jgi:CHAT domain-containing protein
MKTLFIKPALFLIFISAPVFSQIAKDTLTAHKLILNADTLFDRGEYESSLAQLSQAAETYRTYKLLPRYYSVEQKIAENYMRSGKYEQAQELAEKCEREIKTISGTGSTKVMLLNTLGYIQLNKGRNDLALQYFKDALSACHAGMALEFAESYNNLGLAYLNNENYDLALEHFLKSLAIRKEKYGEKHPKVAALYNNIGLNYSFTNSDKALEYYKSALEIYIKLYGNNKHPSLAFAYNNIGLIEKQKKDYNAALDNFENVLGIWSYVYDNNHPNIAFTYSNIGQVFMEKNSLKQAEENLKLALEIYKRNFGSKHPDIAAILNILGSLRLKQGQFKQSLNYFQEAIIANSPEFNEKDLYKNPSILSYYNPNLLLASLSLKARSFEEYHFNKTLKPKDLKIALSTLQSCDSLIDHIRQSRTSKADKVALGATASNLYEHAIKITLDLADVNLNKDKYNQLAFYFNEKSKASVLLEAISESNAKQFSGIPDSLIEKEQQLKADIAYYEQKLADKPDAKLEKSYRDKIFTLNRKYEAFTANLGKNFPEYYNLKFNISIATPKDIASSLDARSALISYFTGETSGRIYIFVVEKNSFKIINVAKQPKFERNITGLRNAIKYNSPEVFAECSYNLYSQLFPKKISSKIQNLIIIPDGKLGTVPFEAFLDKKQKGDDFSNAGFLVKKYALSYDYSATLLIQTMTKQQLDIKRSVMLFAPVDFKNVETKEVLTSLPATESEVLQIRQLFTDKSFQTKSFIGSGATETEIKSAELSQYKYLHFATHGVVNETYPELSEIFLNCDKPKKEDGNVYSGEIFNLKIKADLVTLSACQTGLGKVTKGEGIIGLSRALLYAGAKNIVVSLWAVSDESTSKLMLNFYSNILNTSTTGYNTALREAKLSLMENKTYSNPYYWAPFVLIGK